MAIGILVVASIDEDVLSDLVKTPVKDVCSNFHRRAVHSFVQTCPMHREKRQLGHRHFVGAVVDEELLK